MDVHVDPSSYVDPNGFLFHHEGRVFRAVRPAVADRYRALLDDGTLKRLEAERGLVGTQLATGEFGDLGDVGLVLEHEVVHPLTYAAEWPPSMLRDAALVTLDLSLDLLDRGLMLQDAYPWNVLYRGSEPVFVDLTSIVPLDDRVMWPAHDQFQAFFARPLRLASFGLGDVARAFLLDNISGIGMDRFLRLAPLRFRVRHPGLRLAVALDRYVQKRPETRKRLKARLEATTRTIPPDVRRRFYGRARRQVAGLRFRAAGDHWARYYAEIPPAADREAKLDRVRSLLDRLSPASVVDLGANTGVFSLEAARRGARVVSLDSAEACMESLYAEARRGGLPITPLVVDLLTPTPAHGFLGEQYPALFDRVQGDLALCLGLVHHLHVAGRQSFDRITELLARATRRWLVFEHVDRDDANNELIGMRREMDYSLESVLDALGRRFDVRQRFPSDRPTRTLVLAELRAS